MSLLNALQVEYLPLADIKDYRRNLRKFGKKQIAKTIRLIESCGFPVPVLVDKDYQVIVGQAFIEAARKMNMETVPVIIAEHLSDEQARLLRMAYSRLAEEEDWVRDELAAEFIDLQASYPDLDLAISGFELPEIDLMLDLAGGELPAEDDAPEPESGPTVSQPGDLWELGNHRLYCGDSRLETSYMDEYLRQQKMEHIHYKPTGEGVKMEHTDDGVLFTVTRFYQIPTHDGPPTQNTYITAVIKLPRVAAHIGYGMPHATSTIEKRKIGEDWS